MKIILCMLLVFSFSIVSCTDKTDVPPKTDRTELTEEDLEEIVYITMSGEKYHTEICQFVRMERTAITKGEAIDRNYEPCKRCKP